MTRVAGLWARGRFYARTGARLSVWAILLWLLILLLQRFEAAMVSRLGHLGEAELRRADWPCSGPQCDFSTFWPAGWLARAHRVAEIYDPAALARFQHEIFFAAAGVGAWFYPPPALLPVMAISYLPFEPAFWVWSAGLTLASIGLLRRAGFSWVVVVASMLSPAALWNAELGQFGTITGVGVVASLALSARRSAGGGVVLGLLVVKPQAGLLVPVALLARGQWRRLAVAAGTGLAACLAVTLAAGWTVWPVYFSRGAAASKAVLEALFPAADYEKFGISVFWMLRLAGAGLGAAYLAQAVCAIGAVFLAWRVWRDERGLALDRIGLTVSLSLLATPYGYADDMVGWSVMLAALAERRGWRINLLDALFRVWPALAPVVFLRTGFLATPVVVGVAAWRIWRRREVQMMP